MVSRTAAHGHNRQRAEKRAGSFQAIVINDDRVSVLAVLMQQAVEHFGHSDVKISNVQVSADDRTSTYLATADFSSVAEPARG